MATSALSRPSLRAPTNFMPQRERRESTERAQRERRESVERAQREHRESAERAQRERRESAERAQRERRERAYHAGPKKRYFVSKFTNTAVDWRQSGLVPDVHEAYVDLFTGSQVDGQHLRVKWGTFGVKPHCPYGWRVWGDSCYYIGRSEVSYETAVSACHNMAAHVVEINSEAEQTILGTITSARDGDKYWVGLRFSQSKSWYNWWHQVPLAAQSSWWSPGTDQTAAFGSDTCVIMGRTAGFKWTTQHCGLTSRVICEIDGLACGTISLISRTFYADARPWMDLDFGREMYVAAIETSGDVSTNSYTKAYSLQTSSDGVVYNNHGAGSEPCTRVKVYQANTEPRTTVRTFIQPRISTRYLRVIPVAWFGRPTLTLGVLGCESALIAARHPGTVLGVFNRRGSFDFPAAHHHCSKFHSRMASYSELLAAFHAGMSETPVSWLTDRTARYILDRLIVYSFYKNTGIISWGVRPSSITFSAYCMQPMSERLGCATPLVARQPCAWDDVTPRECELHGCCWDPYPGYPSCFHKTAGTNIALGKRTHQSTSSDVDGPSWHGNDGVRTTSSCDENNGTCVKTANASSQGCPDGYVYHLPTLWCYKAFDDVTSYSGAVSRCSLDGGTLAMPRDAATNSFLIDLKNAVHNNALFRFGLTDVHQEGVFMWDDNVPLGDFRFWGPGNPDNYRNEDCVEYLPERLFNRWNDGPCAPGSRKFICQVSGCPDGYVYHQPSLLCYKAFNNRTTYSGAVSRCSLDGGTLAMPRDAATNSFLIDLKNAVDTNAWFRFGLTDVHQEGVWMWDDNVPLCAAFRPWGQGEPNNSYDEDCAEYVPENGSPDKKNTWNDGPCTNADRKFICQVSPSESHPWWYVDLDRQWAIDRVTVVKPGPVDLNPFFIHVGDHRHVSANPQCGQNHSIAANQSELTVSCGGMRGRYVGIRLGEARLLQFSELEVYPVADEANIGGINVAALSRGGRCVGASQNAATCGGIIDGQLTPRPGQLGWLSSQGVGSWVQLKFDGYYFINRAKIAQSTWITGQSRTIRLTFSDGSYVDVKLRKREGSDQYDVTQVYYDEFVFDMTKTDSVKMTVLSAYTAASSSGFIEAQFITAFPEDFELIPALARFRQHIDRRSPMPVLAKACHLSLADCAINCLEEPAFFCQSFQYKAGTRNCEMFGWAAPKDGVERLVTAPSVSYFERHFETYFLFEWTPRMTCSCMYGDGVTSVPQIGPCLAQRPQNHWLHTTEGTLRNGETSKCLEVFPNNTVAITTCSPIRESILFDVIDDALSWRVLGREVCFANRDGVVELVSCSDGRNVLRKLPLHEVTELVTMSTPCEVREDPTTEVTKILVEEVEPGNDEIQNLTVSLVTEEGFYLTWNVTSSLVIGYRVTYHRMDSQEMDQLYVHRPEVHLRGLLPGVEYNVTITAITAEFVGSAASLKQYTLSVVDPPSDFYVVTVTARSATLMWAAPGGEVAAYVLELIPADAPSEAVNISLSNTLTSTDVTGLIPVHGYVAKLYAVGPAGVSDGVAVPWITESATEQQTSAPTGVPSTEPTITTSLSTRARHTTESLMSDTASMDDLIQAVPIGKYCAGADVLRESAGRCAGLPSGECGTSSGRVRYVLRESAVRPAGECDEESDDDVEVQSDDGFGDFEPPSSYESWESENPKQESEVSSSSTEEADDLHEQDLSPSDTADDEQLQADFPPLMVEGLAIPSIDAVDVTDIASTDPVALVEALAAVMQPDLDDHPVAADSTDKTLSDDVSKYLARALSEQRTCKQALDTLNIASERLQTTIAAGVLAQLCEAVIKECKNKSLEEQLSYLTVLDNLNDVLGSKSGTTQNIMRTSTGKMVSRSEKQADVDPTRNDDFLSPEERADQERQKKEESDQKKRVVVGGGREVLDNMADRLRRQLTPGGPGVRIDSDRLSLQVHRMRGKDLAGHRLNGTRVNVVFPPAEKLFKGFVPKFVDTKLISYHANPFTWGNNSNIINSAVHDVSLIPSTMSIGDIRDAEDDILITIATNGDRPSGGLVHGVDSTGNESVVQHVFNISDVDDAFIVQVTALNRSSRISVFGRGGGLAHSKNCEVCFPWQDWKPTFSRHGAPEPRSVAFFVSGKNHTGKYTVGVEVAGLEDVYQDVVEDGVFVVDPADKSDVNGTQFYSLEVWRLSCRYWAEDTETWLPNGCTVHPTSTITATVCACNHMTAFGAGFVTAPNTIDLTTVFDKFTDIGNNAGVLATVLTSLALYVAAVMFLRKADRAGVKKLIVHGLPDNRSTDRYYYKMTVFTSHARGSGTKSNVGFSLLGDKGSTGVRVFKQSQEAGGVDIFLLAVQESLGDLLRLQIWHDNQGGNDRAWKLDKVIVRDLQSGETTSFLCDQWLSLDHGDGRISRILPSSTEQDLSSFHLFTTKAVNDFRNEHIWLSIFFCPSSSHFSRVQRLSCGLCIVYTTMIANAMWYRTEDSLEQNNVVNLGIVSFTLHELYVSAMTSLCVLPVNVLLVQLFNRCREKQQPTKNAVNVAEKEDIRSLLLKTRSSSRFLPHVFVYVAWSILVLSCGVSAFFTILYSLEWGAVKANAWLKTFLMSFVQDVLVVEPFKILAVSALVSYVCKKVAVLSTRDDVVLEHADVEYSNQSESLFAWVSQRATTRVTKQQLRQVLLKHDQTEKSQKERQEREETRKKTDNVIQEVAGFFVFVMILLLLVNSGTNVYSHHAYNTIGDLFQSDFDEISTADDYWTWARDVLIPGLFQENHYNSERLGWRRKLFISDTTSYRIAAARYRQIRVKPRPCDSYRRYTSLYMSQECNSGNSFSDEETRDFLPGWTPLSSSNSSDDVSKPSPWTYHLPGSGDELPVMGAIATYGSGGYVTGVGRNKAAALAVIADLKEAGWIDRYTRAVIVEFTVYNANVNFFSTMSYMVEFLITGGAVPSHSVWTYRLHRFVGTAGYILMALHILYVVCFLYTLYREVKAMKEQGRRYCLQPWNLLEIANILVCFGAVAVFAVDYTTSRNTLDKLPHYRDSSKFISFDQAVLWNQAFVWTVATVAFINIFKFLRLLRFNPMLSVLMTSMRRMAPEVTGFAVYFSVLFLSFVQLGHLVFGLKIQGYSTIVASGKSLFVCTLGMFDFDEILSTSREHQEILWELWRRLSNFLGLTNSASQEDDMLASERLEDCLARLDLLVRAMKERQVAENVMRRIQYRTAPHSSRLRGTNAARRPRKVHHDFTDQTVPTQDTVTGLKRADMGRKLRHLLIFLLIILEKPNMPECSNICEPSSRGRCPNLGLTNIPQNLPPSTPNGTLASIPGLRIDNNPWQCDSAGNRDSNVDNTHTTAAVVTSGPDHQYEDIDQHDQIGQGQSQAVTESCTSTNTTAEEPVSGHGVNTPPKAPASSATEITSDHDQTGQGQSQALTKSSTETTAVVVPGFPEYEYEDAGRDSLIVAMFTH
ncbi:hypothetical protein Bbelb_231650 [Branchiostoma belcheri]|nr:hypothetical protein Bbelb_231650 [Branchiostoma belcheri]